MVLYVNFKEFAVTKLSFSLTSILIFSICPCLVQAKTVETEEWQIEADKVIRFDNPNSIIAEGQVVLTKIRKLPPKQLKNNLAQTTQWSVLLEEAPFAEDTNIVTQEIDSNAPPRYKTEVTIKADWIAYDMENNSIKARGNVSIANGIDQLTASEGSFNLNNETGTFKQATIIRDSLDLHLEGETIEKTGFNTYHIEDAWAITCEVDEGVPPPLELCRCNYKSDSRRICDHDPCHFPHQRCARTVHSLAYSTSG